MKILKPDYYDEFKCIAAKCKDTCCSGWKIDVDKKSFNRYRKIRGEYGRYINKHLARNRNSKNDLQYSKIQLLNGSCAYLNDEKLCNIYINYGEDYMCNTCKIYPRSIRKYGDKYERALTLSCPEVAKMIVYRKESIGFELIEEKLSELDLDYINESKEEYYNMLWDTRSLMIEIAQFKEIPVWKRMVFIKLVADKVQKKINEDKNREHIGLLQEMRGIVQDEHMINKLDEIPDLIQIRTLLVNEILQERYKQGISNKVFISLICELEGLYKEYGFESDTIRKLEKEYNQVLEMKEYVLEHYIVNQLYSKTMSSIEDRNLDKKIMSTIIGYAIIKKLLFARWYKNGGKIVEEDMIDVLYSFTKTVEHNGKFIDDIYKMMQDEGYNTLAWSTILAK